MNSIQSVSGNDCDQFNEASPKRTAFSVQETAAQLGVCPASIYRALKRGDIDAVMLGGRRLIPRRSIEKLLTAGRKTASSCQGGADDAG